MPTDTPGYIEDGVEEHTVWHRQSLVRPFERDVLQLELERKTAEDSSNICSLVSTCLV